MRELAGSSAWPLRRRVSWGSWRRQSRGCCGNGGRFVGVGGAGAYFLPNALFALRLLVNVVRAARPNPFAFLYGELLKLLMTALLLWLLSWLAQGWLVWPAVLLGLVFTLKGYLLLLMLRKRS